MAETPLQDVQHKLDGQFGKDVTFLPWIGTDYSAPKNALKVLILAESHYEPEDASVEAAKNDITPDDDRYYRYLTRDAILRQFGKAPRYNAKYAFYTKVMRLFVATDSQSISDEDREHFWSQYSFFNFWQELLSFKTNDDSTLRPIWNDQTMVKKSQDAFLNVLAVLQPDLVIALGRTMYSYLPPEDIEQESYLYEEQTIPQCQYQIDGKIIQVVNIPHPRARGFSADHWRDPLKHFLVA